VRIRFIEVGECAVTRPPDLVLETCLGSCVAVALNSGAVPDLVGGGLRADED